VIVAEYNRNLMARARVLATLVAAGAVLIAAAPADAIYRDYEGGFDDDPTIDRTIEKDDTGTAPKEGCSVNLQNPDGSPGPTVKYDHGYSFSVQNKATGKTHTFTCNDGKWEETVNFTPTNYGEYLYEVENDYYTLTP
jgi:hypothetical protein